jgi:succinate dehydrogenase/fumarate reductase-like Fe-S protein
MAETRPLTSGNQSHKVRLNFFRIPLGRQLKPASKSGDMSVDNNAFFHRKGVSKHHIRGLSADTREPDQLRHGTRNLSAVEFQQISGHSAQILCLISVKSCGLDLALQFSLTRLGKVFRGAIFLKQATRYDVDSLVGALRRKNRGNQKLKGCLKFQFAMRIRISFFKFPNDALDALLSFHRSFFLAG